MKAKECQLVLNTRWGYILQPWDCKSIAEATRRGKEMGMAGRIFVDGKLVKRV